MMVVLSCRSRPLRVASHVTRLHAPELGLGVMAQDACMRVILCKTQATDGTQKAEAIAGAILY
jgi:hypothetical protein